MPGPTLQQIKGRCRITPNDCWEWAQCTESSGYGRIRVDGKTWRVHRYVYKLVHGRIVNGYEVFHDCHNKRCCNPEHLRSGTRKTLLSTMKSNGRTSSGMRHGLVMTKVARARTATKLNLDKARAIRQLHAGGQKTNDLAEQFDVHSSNVRLIVSGKAWKEANPFRI